MRRVWIVGLSVAALAATALAQTTTATVTITRKPAVEKGFDEVRISKAALPGQEIRIWAAQMLEPDCTAHGTMKAEILEPPRHGLARLSDEPFFGFFPPNNVRALCDAKKAPGEQAFYTAAADFHGHDKLVMQNSTSEGRIRKIVVDIDVR
jgi:hypothetical protein